MNLFQKYDCIPYCTVDLLIHFNSPPNLILKNCNKLITKKITPRVKPESLVRNANNIIKIHININSTSNFDRQVALLVFK